MSWDKWEENTLCIEMLCIACWLDGVTCIRNSTEIDYIWVTSGNSYVLPSNHMLESVDTDDCFYLVIGTEVGYVRPHEKPPETEASLCSISWALDQIPIISQIPVMNQSGELSEVSYYGCYLEFF